MSRSSFAASLQAGDVDFMLEQALQHRVEWVTGQLDYDTMDEHAAAVSRFFHAWTRALPPPERLQAARWASSQYLLALVHLDHSYAIGAQILLEAQQAAAVDLADSLRQFRAFTDGPDAEIPASVADRLDGFADLLEGMSFSQ